MHAQATFDPEIANISCGPTNGFPVVLIGRDSCGPKTVMEGPFLRFRAHGIDKIEQVGQLLTIT